LISPRTLGLIAYLGIIIWATGLVIETIADAQKFMFNNDPEKKGRWIDEGLWHYSRHPNYFGEILCWIGIYVYAFYPEFEQGLVGLISPLFIILLLLFISGIPLLEKASDEKWGHNHEYKKYKRTTSVLIPKFK
jgi:steroid 5-alpha reductase family enzyme